MIVKNWTKYQHYKDRNPPWIKMHRTLLTDRLFIKLDPLASKLLVLCWLLAAEGPENDGSLPSVEDISFRTHISEKDIKAAFLKLDHWILSDNSDMLADCKQLATPETETETETEVEKRKSKSKRFTAPNPNEILKHFLEKGSDDFEADKFFNFYESKGWKVGNSPMKSWTAAANGWISRNGEKKTGAAKAGVPGKDKDYGPSSHGRL